MNARALVDMPARLWSRVSGEAIAALCVTAGCVLLLAPTARSLHVEWTDFERLTYTHGYLIAAVSLLALLRAARDFETPRPDWRLALLLVPAGLCWLIAYRSGIELLHQLMLPAICFMALAAALGLANAWKARFAFIYLYFASSAWDVLTGALQGVSVAMARLLLTASGVPVHVSGHELYIPEGSFAVDPGCSGLHYLIVALSLAVLFGELHRDSLKVRLRQIALAGFLALLSNWVRIYCVVLAGHLTDMQHYLVRVEHYKFGWGVFAAATLLFLWIASRAAPAPAATPGMQMTAPAPAPVLVRGVALSLAMLGAGVSLLVVRPVRPAPPSGVPLLAPLAGWSGPSAYEGAWDPLYPRSDRAERGVYRRAGQSVAAFVAEYDVQFQGKELSGYGNSLSNGLRERSGGGLLAGTPMRWQRVDSGGIESVLVRRLRVGSSRYASGLAAQLGYGVASLQGPQRSAIIAAVAACRPDCATAIASAGQLVDALDLAQGAVR